MWVSKNIRRSLASSVFAVLLLQVLAAGFCVPTTMAADALLETKHVVSMHDHKAAPKQHHQDEQATHACSHCDLPDLILSWDKANSAFADVVLAFIYVQTFAVVQHEATTAASHTPPPLRTSLLTHDLNQRIRV